MTKAPLKIKEEIKVAILEALDRDGKADKKILISSLSLETGFTEKPILKMFENMVTVNLIESDGKFLYKKGTKPN